MYHLPPVARWYDANLPCIQVLIRPADQGHSGCATRLTDQTVAHNEENFFTIRAHRTTSSLGQHLKASLPSSTFNPRPTICGSFRAVPFLESKCVSLPLSSFPPLWLLPQHTSNFSTPLPVVTSSRTTSLPIAVRDVRLHHTYSPADIHMVTQMATSALCRTGQSTLFPPARSH